MPTSRVAQKLEEGVKEGVISNSFLLKRQRGAWQKKYDSNSRKSRERKSRERRAKSGKRAMPIFRFRKKREGEEFAFLRMVKGP